MGDEPYVEFLWRSRAPWMFSRSSFVIAATAFFDGKLLGMRHDGCTVVNPMQRKEEEGDKKQRCTKNAWWSSTERITGSRGPSAMQLLQASPAVLTSYGVLLVMQGWFELTLAGKGSSRIWMLPDNNENDFFRFYYARRIARSWGHCAKCCRGCHLRNSIYKAVLLFEDTAVHDTVAFRGLPTTVEVAERFVLLMSSLALHYYGTGLTQGSSRWA